MLSVVLLLCSLVHLSVTNNAFVSILTTDEFTLAAKVLAHSISVQRMKEPYIIFYTDNVSQQSLNALRAIGLETVRIQQIDTPSLSLHTEAKFQYTRMNLWAMTNYSTLVSLDLDTIVERNVSDLFRCGSFCASMRHSDKFNCGVMVLKPNRTVYEDMIAKYSRLPSYDGGDQGFFNSYFAHTKFASMFNPDEGSLPSNGVHTLSMAYNYDVGAYYLQSRLLIEPLITHYTLGPTKPWHWWTYPMFDLNWKWHNFRVEVDERENRECAHILYVSMRQAFVVLSLSLMHKVLSSYTPTHAEWITGLPQTSLFLSLQLLSLVLSFFTVPPRQGIFISWAIFIINQVLLLVLFTAVYSRLAHGTVLSTMRTVQFVIIVPISAAWIWCCLYSIPLFSDRCAVMFVLVALWFLMVNLLCRRLLMVESANSVRYQPVKTS